MPHNLDSSPRAVPRPSSRRIAVPALLTCWVILAIAFPATVAYGLYLWAT